MRLPSKLGLKNKTARGKLENTGDGDVTGSARFVAKTGKKKPTTLANGKVGVAAGGTQSLALKLTKAGRAYFKRHKKARGELVLRLASGTTSRTLRGAATVSTSAR